MKITQKELATAVKEKIDSLGFRSYTGDKDRHDFSVVISNELAGEDLEASTTDYLEISFILSEQLKKFRKVAVGRITFNVTVRSESGGMRWKKTVDRKNVRFK